MHWRELRSEDWRGYGRNDFPEASWTEENGCLRAIGGTERVDLISRGEFGDFELTLAWRLPKAGNSGVLYRVAEDWAASWQSGPELQLVDIEHTDSARPETACGALYDLLATRSGIFSAEMANARTHFNHAQLRVRHGRAEHWLNGVMVLDYDLDSAALKERIRHSKFSDCPDFARRERGHIVLQHHGSDAWFRDVRIRPLP